MDQDRQIRFAIPPFFLFASLLWGAYLDGRNLSPIFAPDTAKEVLGLLAAAAVAVVPMGFLISVLSITLLRALALITKTPTYEASLTDSAFDRIWKHIATAQAKDKKLVLYAAATFDHELLPSGIHTWLLRRWNSFNVATHSSVALLVAHAVAPILSIRQSCWWWVSTLALVALLVVAALTAWRETMAMLDFQSHRQQKEAP
jgi:hypothetical protein